MAGQRGHLSLAERFHRRALGIQKKLDPNGPALASGMACLARIAYLRTHYAKAREYYKDSLSIRERISPGSLDVAWSLIGLGDVSYDLVNFKEAEQFYDRALDIARKVAPNSRAVIVSLTNLYLVAFDRGELVKAEEYQRKALDIEQKLAPEGLDVAMSLHRIGDVLASRGDLDQAEQYYGHALEIRRKLAPDTPAFASSLTRLGLIAYERGELVKAESYYRQALAIRRKLGPGDLDVASSLNLLGHVAYQRGNLADATRYYQNALVIRERLTPASVGVVEILHNLGLVADAMGDLMKAELYCRRALNLELKLVPNSLDAAKVLSTLGDVLRERGHLSKANYYQRQALVIQEKLNPNSPQAAWTLSRLGKIATDAGNLAEAGEYLQQAVAIQERYSAGATGHAEILTALADVQKRSGRLEQAASSYQQALTILENRVIYTTNESLFPAAYAQCSEQFISLLMRMQHPELAFEMVERSRSRSLLEMLAKARVDIYKDVDPDLVERERSLQDQLVSKMNQEIRVLSFNYKADRVATIEQEIELLLSAHRHAEEQIRDANPAYAALTRPPVLGISAIQQQLLEHDSVLLEYSLGEHNSYLWVISSESFLVYELPKRSEIEGLARRVYALLTAANDLQPMKNAMEGQARLQQKSFQYDIAAAKLSRMILGDAYPALRGKRLLIVSDGALQYIPFAALPAPKTSSPDPLALRHEIVNLPSASVLAELRRQASGHQETTDEIAVLADPVFSRGDTRVATDPGDSKNHNGVSGAGSLGATPTVATRPYLSRLVFSGLEAKAIFNVVPSNKKFVAVGFQASRALAKSPELRRYRIIHFATHGVVDTVHPELSGLVLSLVDERGKPQDGYLGLQEIYRLNLPADLVVLSGCETALGKEIRGEGIIGLTRGFMYAGSRRVIASLWKVDDLATAELMGRFYRALEVERISPAAALRKAQVSIWKEQQWHHPFFWAAFQLQGEWK